jgi:hypothetical protein
MPSFSGFAEGLANLASGGMYNAFTKKPGDDLLPKESPLSGKTTEELKKIYNDSPGILERVGNLLSGGIYGAATGMQDRIDLSDKAAAMIRQEELEKRLMRRLAAMGPQPMMTPEMMQPQTPESQLAPYDPNKFM